MSYAAVLVGSMVILAGASNVQIPQWQPHDFAFRSSTDCQNPFTVAFQARVVGPNREELVIPGFYDGDGVWKIRFSPTAVGQWSLKTSSDDPELDGKLVNNILCTPQTNPNIRGGLRIDKKNPHHFIREDGSRFYLMGYECDWLWAMDAADNRLPTTNAFLDKLSEHGFNYIITNVYAHDTPWREGKTGPHDYGPPTIYPWEGDNNNPVQSRLNLEFWQHYDRVIEAMHQRGIIAHIMTKVYNKMVKWPAKLSAEEDLYYRTLVARYSAYPNVVWDFSKEAHGEGDYSYKAKRIKATRELDPYNRPFTVHDDSETYDRGDYNDLLDYRSDQNHGDWHKTILHQRAQRSWPVVNVEFGYEWGPKGEGDSTFPPCQSPHEVLGRAWEICMAGGYCAYYYTYTAWDIIHPEHTPYGYANFKRLRQFFENTRYWLVEPHDDLVSGGYCLADPGREYVVYQPDYGDFTLRIQGAQRELKSEWFNPLTGQRLESDDLGNGSHKISMPHGWGGPVVLHLRADGNL